MSAAPRRSRLDVTGYSLLGSADAGRLLVFSSNTSHNVRVYDLSARSELANSDPDFPRFTVEGDHLTDLDMQERFELAGVAS